MTTPSGATTSSGTTTPSGTTTSSGTTTPSGTTRFTDNCTSVNKTTHRDKSKETTSNDNIPHITSDKSTPSLPTTLLDSDTDKTKDVTSSKPNEIQKTDVTSPMTCVPSKPVRSWAAIVGSNTQSHTHSNEPNGNTRMKKPVIVTSTSVKGKDIIAVPGTAGKMKDTTSTASSVEVESEELVKARLKYLGGELLSEGSN